MKLLFKNQLGEARGLSDLKSAITNNAAEIFVVAISVLALWFYAQSVFYSFQGRWFDPIFTTGDGRQQLFPFYQAIYPNVFDGDLIYISMRGYLAPLHWAIGYLTTIFTQDPVMTGHWMMLFQLVPIIVFLFLTVRRLASTPAALFCVDWFLHTRTILRATEAGLPRGWAGGILTAYLYFVTKKNHWGVLAVLLVGSMLNSLGTFVAGASYGLYLCYGLINPKTRQEFKRPFIQAIVFAPVLLVVTVVALKRPAEIGSMVSLREAESMSAFTRPGGRFEFVPFKPVVEEAVQTAFRAFVTKWGGPDEAGRLLMIEISIAFFLLLLFVQVRYKQELIPIQLITFLIALICCYAAARIFAFHLYVPTRYLAWPPAVFSWIAFSVAIWRLGQFAAKTAATKYLAGFCALLLLAGFLWIGGGSGFEVYHGNPRHGLKIRKDDRRGAPYPWIRANIPEKAVVASHPSVINGIQLFGARRGYITTETAHPFYKNYWQEVERRLTISLKAYFAADEKSFLEAIGDEKIDYFVFAHSYFKEDKDTKLIKKTGLFKPFDKFVKQLTGHPPGYFLGGRMPKTLKGNELPYVVFASPKAVIIDLRLLREHLQKSS